MTLQFGLEVDETGQLVLRVLGVNDDGTFTPLGVCSGPSQTVRAYAIAFVDEWWETITIDDDGDDDSGDDDGGCDAN